MTQAEQPKCIQGRHAGFGYMSNKIAWHYMVLTCIVLYQSYLSKYVYTICSCLHVLLHILQGYDVQSLLRFAP